jgi:hypothetical protein
VVKENTVIISINAPERGLDGPGVSIAAEQDGTVTVAISNQATIKVVCVNEPPTSTSSSPNGTSRSERQEPTALASA